MQPRPKKPYCTDGTWQGRSDCKHCGVRKELLFAEIPDSELDKALYPIDNFSYEPEGIIYRLGEPGAAVFAIRRGLVKLLQVLPNGSPRAVRLLRPGEVVGLEALIDEPYHHNAVALQEVNACRIPVAVLHNLEETASPLHRRLTQQWQKSVEEADDFIRELSSGPAKARVARLLFRLDGKSGGKSGASVSREAMGAILGITTETASRIMADLKRQGIIREEASRFYYDDLAALKAIAKDG